MKVHTLNGKEKAQSMYIASENRWDEAIRSQKLQTGRYNIWEEKKKHPNIIQLIKSNVLLDMQHETASWG